MHVKPSRCELEMCHHQRGWAPDVRWWMIDCSTPTHGNGFAQRMEKRRVCGIGFRQTGVLNPRWAASRSCGFVLNNYRGSLHFRERSSHARSATNGHASNRNKRKWPTRHTHAKPKRIKGTHKRYPHAPSQPKVIPQAAISQRARPNIVASILCCPDRKS